MCLRAVEDVNAGDLLGAAAAEGQLEVLKW